MHFGVAVRIFVPEKLKEFDKDDPYLISGTVWQNTLVSETVDAFKQGLQEFNSPLQCINCHISVSTLMGVIGVSADYLFRFR